MLPVYGEKGIPKPDNDPGARSDAAAWYDSYRQEFWLFGGQRDGMLCKLFSFVFNNQLNKNLGLLLNDLWRYRLNDSTWTWISGSNTTNQRGVYGEKGTASTEYVPGARGSAVGWYDSLRQEFWVFGGWGFGKDSSNYDGT